MPHGERVLIMKRVTAGRQPGTARRQAAGYVLAAGVACAAAACGNTAPGPAPSSPAAARPATPPPARTSAAADRRAAAAYLAIARPANRQLDRDFDGFDDNSRDNLAAAASDLRDAAATERRFDRQLLQLTLPPAAEAIARLMVTANQSRA